MTQKQSAGHLPVERVEAKTAIFLVKSQESVDNGRHLHFNLFERRGYIDLLERFYETPNG